MQVCKFLDDKSEPKLSLIVPRKKIIPDSLRIDLQGTFILVKFILTNRQCSLSFFIYGVNHPKNFNFLMCAYAGLVGSLFCSVFCSSSISTMGLIVGLRGVHLFLFIVCARKHQGKNITILCMTRSLLCFLLNIF
jgi:hypothetical protein